MLISLEQKRQFKMLTFILTLIPIIVPIACLYVSYEIYKIVKRLDEKIMEIEKKE